MRASAAFAALFTLALLAGCTTPDDQGPAPPAEPGPGSDPHHEAGAAPEPVAIRDSFDLLEGVAQEYEWDVGAGFKESSVRVVRSGPAPAFRGPGSLCLSFAAEETHAQGTSRQGSDSCVGTGFTLSSDTSGDQVLLEHATAPSTLHGTYRLTISAEPQVGTLDVEIVAAY